MKTVYIFNIWTYNFVYDTTLILALNEESESNSKWKSESEAFRAILKAARTGEKVTVIQPDSRIQWPNWGRRFNENAAERHIEFCTKKEKDFRMVSTDEQKKQDYLNKKKAIAQYGRIAK